MASKRNKPSKASQPPDDAQPTAFDQTKKRFASLLRIVATSLAAGFVVVLSFGLFAPRWPIFQSSQQAGQPAAEFVGSEACSGCHRVQAALWRDSQHKHAMDHATEKSVLGDFSDATFDYDGVRSRFFRKDGKTQIPIKIGGTREKPSFGLDFHHKDEQKKSGDKGK